MKTKGIILGFVIIILVATTSVYVFLNYRNVVLTGLQKHQENTQTSTVQVEKKVITDTTKPLNITIAYPFIAGADGFNKKVKDIVDGELENFKKAAMENDQAVKETDPDGYAKYPRTYDFMISYESGEVSETMASFLFSIYADVGGAHGNGYFASVNYNIKENQNIALAELFDNDPNYLTTISDFCIADLKRQMNATIGDSPDNNWVREGAGPKLENFSAFLVKQKSITFYFAPYQVSSYAAGSFEVVMPR